LILRKISRFDATGCQILRLICTKIDFRWGSAPGLWRSLQRSPDSLAVCKGPTSKGRAGEMDRGERGERKVKGRGGEVRRGEGRRGARPPNILA